MKLDLARRQLWGGGVLALPTESVWGLSCMWDDESALLQLLSLKQRDPGKGMIVVSDCADHFESFLSELPASRRRAVLDSWPGSTTWLVPHRGDVLPLVSGGSDKVALRVTAHPLFAALCAVLGAPVVSTSANPSGRPPARDQLALRKYFSGAISSKRLALLSGKTLGNARPSRIIDALDGTVIRP